MPSRGAGSTVDPGATEKGSTVNSTAHSIEDQRKIVNRLRRAQGQLGAVIAAVEDGADCRDVIIQLAAVSKALDRAGFAIVSSALKHCLTDSGEVDGRLDVEELEKLFLILA